ncbi:mce related protein [Mucilaginibacter gotjawali]|uniref:Mce related protein n=1 Tax=Mucilaginibacter gotjawali TaxID=1550579 RepID=A0A110B3U5_9SPHI|nr:MlaD family protein [Mucilaginibacter gotjawali]BAU55062.1 mce related protein [Mucilaginibacter gotjawali]
MANQGENNVKLGLFVSIGLLVLIFSFYMIGKNRNLFGSNFQLKVRFSNTSGLIEGDNVLYAGIQAGTVKNIGIVNDSTIEVLLTMDDKIKPFIKENAIASIGTEGLMGDKVVNISPAKIPGHGVNNGDILATRKAINTDEMLQTLSKSNSNIAAISEGLKTAVTKLNNSAIWELLNDKGVVNNAKITLQNISKASANANEMTKGLTQLVTHIKQGKGTAGLLLADTGMAGNLKEAMASIQSAGNNANNLTIRLNDMVKDLNGNLTNGNGTLHLLLKDTTLAKNLNISMENVKKGTDGFNQDMEALKHNFLLRGYFKNLEKQKRNKNSRIALRRKNFL